MVSRLIVSLLLHSILQFLSSQSAPSEVVIRVKGKPVRVALHKTEYANRTLLLTLVHNATSEITVQIAACLFSAHGKQNASECSKGRSEDRWFYNDNIQLSFPLAADFEAAGCQAIIGQVELNTHSGSTASSASIYFELLNPSFRMIIDR